MLTTAVSLLIELYRIGGHLSCEVEGHQTRCVLEISSASGMKLDHDRLLESSVSSAVPELGHVTFLTQTAARVDVSSFAVS